jgi:hypothetical protein
LIQFNALISLAFYVDNSDYAAFYTLSNPVCTLRLSHAGATLVSGCAR